MSFDTFYSLFCIVGMVVVGFIFYQAFALGNKTAILIICAHLAISYGDRVYSNRHDGLIYGFYKGFTK